jgi:hypothetical protein
MGKKDVIWVLILGGLGYGVYVAYRNFFWSKSIASDFLVEKTGSSKSVLDNMDGGYVIALAKARKFKKATFKYKGKTYVSATGKALQ